MPKSISVSHVPGTPGQVYYPLSLDTVPKPNPGHRQLLIKLHAAALNHRDLFIRQALYPGVTFGVPLLADGCGTVVQVGSGADPSWLNKRVVLNPGPGWKDSLDGPEDPRGYQLMGGTRINNIGTLQEYCAINESEVEEAPGHLSDVECAAIPLTGLTAWRAVMVKCGAQNLEPGRSGMVYPTFSELLEADLGRNVLITGIGGGVALMALMFATATGANLWVTSGDQAKIDKAIKLGAKGGVIYKEKDWHLKLLSMLPKDNKRFDAIVDGAGADVVEKGAKLLKAGGIISIYGMTTGPTMPFLMHAVLRNIEVKGSTIGSRKEFKEMIDFIKETKSKPVVSRVVNGIENLDCINGLFDEMNRGKQFGKLVINIGDRRQGKL